MSTLWAGPVSLAVAKKTATGEITLVQCTGDGSPTCGEKAAGFSGGPFTALCAFSAGGSFLKRRPDLLAQAQVVHLCDATYTTTNGAQEAPFAEYAARAARGECCFIASASAFANKNHPTGEQTLRMIQKMAGLDSDHVGDAHFFFRGFDVPHAGHATDLAPQLWAQFAVPFLGGSHAPSSGEGSDSLPFSQSPASPRRRGSC